MQSLNHNQCIQSWTHCFFVELTTGASLKRVYFFSESNFWFNLFPLARRKKFERITLNSTLSRASVGEGEG